MALPETDRWEAGYRWWEEVWEDKKQPKDQRLRVSLDYYSLPTLPVCFLAFPCIVLSLWYNQWTGAALEWPASGSNLSHWRWVVFWWADEESAGAHSRYEWAYFFRSSGLNCLPFPALVLHGNWHKAFHFNCISLIFLQPLFFLRLCARAFLNETWFAWFIRAGRLMEANFFLFCFFGSKGWRKGKVVCVCVSVCKREGAGCQMLTRLTPSRTYQKTFYEVL